MSLVTEELKAKAEVYHGHDICEEKSRLLLKEVGLPNGLLPLKDIEECGIVRETGFVWLKQKKTLTHKFDKVGKLVTYQTVVTAYAEPNKIKKLTGVKTKELLIWVSLSDIYVDDPPTGKITFKTPAGLYRSFPTSAFMIEEEAKDLKEDSEAKDLKEVTEAKDLKEVTEAKDLKEVTEAKDLKEVTEAKDLKEVAEANGTAGV